MNWASALLTVLEDKIAVGFHEFNLFFVQVCHFTSLLGAPVKVLLERLLALAAVMKVCENDFRAAVDGPHEIHIGIAILP